MDSWLENTLALGDVLPRDSKTIRENILKSVEDNEIFLTLHNENYSFNVFGFGYYAFLFAGTNTGTSQRGGRIPDSYCIRNLDLSAHCIGNQHFFYKTKPPVKDEQHYFCCISGGYDSFLFI